MTKCLGCGAVLQNEDESKEGYTLDLKNKFCNRCFRITHYNEYIKNDKDNQEYLKKIEEISNTKDLAVITVDLLNLFDLDNLKIQNPVIIAFTKKDLLPKSFHENKFLNKFKTNLNVKDILFVSSKNNYNMDELYNSILKYKVSNNVYLIGLTNSGKSSLINKMLKNYSQNDSDITVSNLPSTTLDFLSKEVNENLNLIDTPGLLDEGNIVFNYHNLNKIIPKKKINPIIYQIKRDQSIILEDILRIDIKSGNDVIIYMSNNLEIKRLYKENDYLSHLKKNQIKINSNYDLVIKGLGFIKFKNECEITLWLDEKVKYYTRKSII